MHFLAEVRSVNGYSSVYALSDAPVGTVLLPIFGETLSHPSKYSLQVGVDRHILPYSSNGSPSPDPRNTWCFLNHSCDPNTYIEAEDRQIVALKPIKAGDELTFNYNTTEWKMSAPFHCTCNTPNCVREIQGFSELSPEQQVSLLPNVTEHIIMLLQEQQASVIPGKRGR